MMFATVIRLKRTGRMARFDDDGRLAEWTNDPRQASYFGDLGAARAAIRGICAPELRAAIRGGRAAVVLDEETGEELIVDAGHVRLWQTPRIPLTGRDRYYFDDPAEGMHRQRRRVRAVVRSIFAEAGKNPTRATAARLTPSRVVAETYTMPASRHGRVSGLLAHMPMR